MKNVTEDLYVTVKTGSFFHLYNKEAFMIHSVKDFVDKKMNNKLICFNNVLDDYLFFYDKTKKDDY